MADRGTGPRVPAPGAAAALGRIENGVHVLPVRVYWEDTDAAGIVYYANYLKFIERARSDMLRLAGVNQQALLAGEGLAFAVRDLGIDYMRPARLEDDLEVRSRVSAISGARLVMEQLVCDRTGMERVRARLTLACIDRGGRPRRLPAAAVQALATLLPSFSSSSGDSGTRDSRYG